MVNSTTIKIKNFKVYAYHGCINEEREKGQYFYIDIKVTLKDNIVDDCLESTLDYVKLCNYVETMFKAKKYNLLESLSFIICNKLIEEFDLKGAVVQIKKKKNSYMPYIDSFSAMVKIDK